MGLDSRNKLLLGGFIVLLVLSYQLAIKKTLVLREAYVAGLEQAEQATDIPRELASLTKKETYLDEQFQQLNLGSSSVQNDLLKFLNSHTGDHGVKIMDFGAPHLTQDGNTAYKSYIFTLEGNFKGILHVAHALENQGNFGAISHMAFTKEKDHRTKKTSLRATIHLEQAY
ncbi:hypothetical protein D2V93_06945 [Flagellimonas taeanensis]|uniref:hypothetical protein n=1 Tax=Flavobacteriaceae TaxID=49546 RepID=UPI000E696A14|nr:MULTISPECIES: hypothetical protein [Allomuricauda]MDC6384609.1 hypothetical protein [Muricauda sp. SK9]RIV51635.1 hypothetical protein D2V93_06945 [Allomuricauda taeanensis]